MRLILASLATLAGPLAGACELSTLQLVGSEPSMEQADPCKANLYASLIGQPADASVVPPASRLVRHIRPDSIVTMDFIPARLNIDIDAGGRIAGVRCG